MLKTVFLAVCFQLFCCGGWGQGLPGSSGIRSFSDFEQIDWSNYIDTSNRFYFSGECHAVACNYDLSYSILRYLLTLGPVNVIIEYPSSFGIIYNEYLEKGDNQLLRGICYSQEETGFWQRLYKLKADRISPFEIKVWGVDFELGNSTSGRSKAFPFALQILTKRRKGNPPAFLNEVIRFMRDNRENLDSIRLGKSRLYDSLDSREIKAFWGADYGLYKMLVSRYDRFKSNRDGSMFQNYVDLVRESLITDSSSRSFCQFGYVHSLLSNKKSFASLLRKDAGSPVRNRLFSFYNQYINCYSNLPINERFAIPNSGPLVTRADKKMALEISESDSARIKVIDGKVLDEKFPSEKASGVDLLIVLSGFEGVQKCSK